MSPVSPIAFLSCFILQITTRAIPEQRLIRARLEVEESSFVGGANKLDLSCEELAPFLSNDGMAGAVVHACVLVCWFQSLVLLALFAANAPLVRAGDTIAKDRPLSGDAKLVSRGGKFALGFFQPDGGIAGRWYVGIWYHNIPVRTPVWVANRDSPVSDPAKSRLTIAADDGNLVLLDSSGALAWSAYAIAANNTNTTVEAVLHDTGNLVLAPSSNATDALWQSFDNIGDTWLPGWRLRLDMVTGGVQRMTSWRARGDPAPGAYTLKIANWNYSDHLTQYVVSWNYGVVSWNYGNVVELDYQVYNDLRILTGPQEVAGVGFNFFSEDINGENYLTYGCFDNSTVFRFVMDVSGQLKGWLWVEETQAWKMVYADPKTWCTTPHGCGAFGLCSEAISNPCNCARGFSPQNAARWRHGDYTDGCMRNVELQCSKNNSNGLKAEEDGFFLMLGMRLPDDGLVAAGVSSSDDCKRACLNDCICSAYAYNVSCTLWYGDLQDMHANYPAGSGGSMYLRLAASELPDATRHKRRTVIKIAVGALAIVCFVVVASVLVIRTTTARRRAAKVQGLRSAEGYVASFTYRDLQSFTNKFSDRLGGGAFGSVFRGQLLDYIPIAVKKLEGFRQGEKQFRAEVSTLGTIQHVNLIRLLGFCSDRKLLVYEYMPNGSLDCHLFGPTLYVLSWRVRYQIVVDVAKGLSYLHHKCRDCIIHCDVKPENILLDVDFVPKVADFGLAKLVGRDFSQVLTTMRGTIGYLAPEWISGEAVTAKVDVYSYGMMLFEIVSGKRNNQHGKTESGLEPSSGGGTGSCDYVATEFFPVLAARRLAEGEGGAKALLDPMLGGDADIDEVTRVLKVACWCIQDKVDARPTMAEVVLVLEGVTEIEVPPVPRYLEMLAGRWMHATRYYSSS